MRSRYGVCPLCGRECPLTFHHLTPRKLHRRKAFRRRYSRETLNEGIHICRDCHDGIHDFYDEKTLAKRFADIRSLQADPALARHFRWVARKKVRGRADR
ncbi:hypothetical protein H0Z60_13195 [Ectothiorhodospiraceae bacterium WFHF3C12]|nr:hypothetical protein [Ectothiorhodospiraceae bacterium WFHF3C12]